MAERVQVGAGSAGTPMSELLDAQLGRADESQRYRVLATLFAEWAERSASGNGKGAETSEQLEGLKKSVKRLEEEKALLTDDVKTARGDLSQQAKLLEAEQARASEMRNQVEDQRKRLAMLQMERSGLEKQVTELESMRHQAEVERDHLQLKYQRAEKGASDTTQVEKLQEENLKLAKELQEAIGATERLRLDKEAEIEQIRGSLVGAKKETSSGADALLTALWLRLARCQPPLVTGPTTPNDKAAERLFDALIELTKFAHEFDQSMRIFLGRYTKQEPTLKTPWEAYANTDDVVKTVQQIIAVTGFRPAGVLKMRLNALKKWTIAAAIGGDAAIESVGSELEQQLRGPLGLAADPKATILNYLKQSGPDMFADALRKLRGEKIAEAWGHGA